MTLAAGKKTAVLLVNLGTPDAPTVPAVRRYLREFLSDPRVVEIPRVAWWFILNVFILPFRAAKSAHAYRTIWTDKGSPLLVYTTDLGVALQEHLVRDRGGLMDLEVGVAMRYGHPSVAEQLDSLHRRGFGKVLVIPLYPQYAAATTASIFDAVFDTVRKWRRIPDLQLIGDYHADTAYIDAVASSIGQFWKARGDTGKLLFSFHGLPERSRALGDPYYDQCHASANSIAQKLGLEPTRWQLVFQSRFGPAEWLKPYCVDVLAELPRAGCQDVDVVCPGFAVDCLETLEEIAIANREVFLKAGGRNYRYIPALNSGPLHVSMMSKLIQRELGSAP
ncbi:MAG: ferrochelatase [Methylotetracoccus sp.]|jgi:ferrochelatase|nr:ferrochelatase [Methylotetracoccus sp.]